MALAPILVGAIAPEPAVWGAGAVSYILVAPLIHAVHDRGAELIASVAMRLAVLAVGLGMAVAGPGTGCLEDPCPWWDTSEAVGMTVLTVLVSGIDASVLAWEP